jgi:hypothetical protein
MSDPIPAAVDQLRRYHNARTAAGEVEEPEGNEQLFHTNQFLIATSYDEAKVGTIGADARFYLEWKDTAPVPLDLRPGSSPPAVTCGTASAPSPTQQPPHPLRGRRTVLLDSVAVLFGQEDVRARFLGRKGAEAPKT